MIFINPTIIRFTGERERKARELTRELLTKATHKERIDFIEANRDDSWGHHDLSDSLVAIVGNKCWYSEVPLEGADSNIDHFRPKGNVVEVDCTTLKRTGAQSPGYWWLAFELRNFRLASMHSNQRRVDMNTAGGKWNYFPVEGARALELTDIDLINEIILPLDPCSRSDVALVWFDPDGNLGFAEWRRKPTPFEERRIKATVWLYHLNKKKIHKRRAENIEEIRIALRNANTAYKLWNPHGPSPDLHSKNRFDTILADIERLIADNSPFAGAKRCAVTLARSEYFWLDEYLPR